MTGLSRAVPAGLVDSGLSSLATFAVGLFAVRQLAPDVLGAYAIGYSAFLLGSGAVARVGYLPYEYDAVPRLEAGARVAVLRRSLPPGLALGLAVGVVVAAATLAIPSDVTLGERTAIALSLVLLVAVSPGQDHCRRLMHLAGRSWTAAEGAACQLGVAGLVVVLAVATGSGHAAWVPFGALAAANVASSTLVYALTRRGRPAGPAFALTMTARLRFGGWLLVNDICTFGGGLLALAVVTTASGAAAAGQAEAARQLSQPVTVVIIGVLSVISAEVLTAATTSDRVRLAVLARRWFLGAALLVGLWAALLGGTRPWNPLPTVFPRAYEVPGLLVLVIVGQGAAYACLLYQSVLTARHRTSLLAAISAATALAYVAVTALLRAHGAWALAIGGLVTAGLDLVLYGAAAVRAMRRDEGADLPPGATPRPAAQE